MVIKKYGQKSGFTIVELIVIIVVIGILATIGVVSWSGAQNRAKKTTFQSNSDQVKLKLGEYFTDNNRYPVDKPAVITHLGANALSTEFNKTAYEYVPSGSGCPGVPANCTSYTITVNKTNWNGDVSDSNLVVMP
jgi:prepilin-type N-terminal cleavage/methylation domain-containing protein